MVRVDAVMCAWIVAFALYGCSHDWDTYDPRTSTGIVVGSGTTSGTTGGMGGMTSVGGMGGMTSVGGMGGSGGMGGQPGDCVLALQDTFDDNVIGAQWNTWEYLAIPDETQGELKVALPDNTVDGTYAGIVSASTHDMTNCSVFVQVTQVLNPATDAYVHLFAYSGMDKIEVLKYGSVFVFKKVINGVHTNLSSASYDPINHAFWRLRESDGMTYWETSSDAKSWVVQASETDSIPFDTVNVGVAAGAFQDEVGQSGEARFDNFNVIP